MGALLVKWFLLSTRNHGPWVRIPHGAYALRQGILSTIVSLSTECSKWVPGAAESSSFKCLWAPIPGVPKKRNARSIFVTLIFENIASFISSDKTLSSEKKLDQEHWSCLISFDSLVISQNMVFFQKKSSFIFMTFQSGIMAFLTSIHCCPEAHWSVQTKQRENLWTVYCYTRRK